MLIIVYSFNKDYFGRNIRMTIDSKVSAKTPASSNQSNSAKNITNKNEDKKYEISIISTGDILFHTPELDAARENNTYNFTPMFSEVKGLLSSKDISVGNFESTINPKKKLCGYPTFNTPVQALDALKAAGFKVLLCDNNHSLDTGIDGLKSTDKLLKQYGFKVVGSGEPNEDKSVILEKNHIKVGMLSYTYGTNYGKKYADMINYIDEVKIKKDISTLRLKCDYLIVYLHIGTEYVRTVERSQSDIVNKLAKMGADAILCSHPHVARKTDILRIDGREVIVNYSLGNFISNQNDKFTDIGTMENLVIEKSGNKTILKSAETIPVYRLRYEINKKTIYKTVPITSINKFKDKLAKNDLAYINNTSAELAFKYNYTEAVPVNNH